ncbi:hypothetical protein F4810DRAFT_652971 [Camillea tinctor]|nr:hypothetical protein F4810DRAFT_652971 [Camillea tinctor]
MASGNGSGATFGRGQTHRNEVNAPPPYGSSQPFIAELSAEPPTRIAELSGEPSTRIAELSAEPPSGIAELSAEPSSRVTGLSTGPSTGIKGRDADKFRVIKDDPEQQQPAKPTADSPFNFPSDIPCPAYSPLASINHSISASTSPSSPSHSFPLPLPIAIPQVRADPTSPFLPAYHPALLGLGIPLSSWTSFLETLSAFLGARVSDRALAHAGDVGRSLSTVPKHFGRDTLSHVRDVGRTIGRDAKSGNLIGAGFAALGGAVSVPVATALRAVGAVTALPFAAVGAVAKKPLSPRERADAYLAVANRDWFRARGLRAKILETRVLAAEVLRGAVTVEDLLDRTQGAGAAEQLRALEGHIARLEIMDEAAARTTLYFGTTSLWLVMMPSNGEEDGYDDLGVERGDGEDWERKSRRKNKRKLRS